MPVVADRVLAREIKAIRPWDMKLKTKLRGRRERRKLRDILSGKTLAAPITDVMELLKIPRKGLSMSAKPTQNPKPSPGIVALKSLKGLSPIPNVIARDDRTIKDFVENSPEADH